MSTLVEQNLVEQNLAEETLVEGNLVEGNLVEGNLVGRMPAVDKSPVEIVAAVAVEELQMDSKLEQLPEPAAQRD